MIIHLEIDLILQLNDYDIRNGKKIGVTISFNNHRLFVGNIPKTRDRDEILEEFSKYARKWYPIRDYLHIFSIYIYMPQKYTCLSKMILEEFD